MAWHFYLILGSKQVKNDRGSGAGQKDTAEADIPPTVHFDAHCAPDKSPRGARRFHAQHANTSVAGQSDCYECTKEATKEQMRDESHSLPQQSVAKPQSFAALDLPERYRVIVDLNFCLARSPLQQSASRCSTRLFQNG
jgi:hypothetical protein